MNQLVTMLAQYGFYLGIPLVFLAIVVWIYRSSATKRYEDDGTIPFREDERVDNSRRGGH
ncbi:MAG: cbb3-type cytochrome oxidase subunit 3 [Thiobacillaceae bacterium]